MRIVALSILLAAGTTGAAELRSMELEREGDRYIATSEVWLDAPREAIYDVLSVWDDAQRFSSLIIESRDIAAHDNDGRPGFYMKNRGCVLFFCKTFERQGDVVRERPSLLRTIADPEASDFEMSEESWRFEAEDGGTLVHYQMEMNPKFWIPPLIGPYAIKRKVRKDGLEALQRIEDYVNETGAGNE